MIKIVDTSLDLLGTQMAFLRVVSSARLGAYCYWKVGSRADKDCSRLWREQLRWQITLRVICFNLREQSLSTKLGKIGRAFTLTFDKAGALSRFQGTEIILR